MGFVFPCDSLFACVVPSHKSNQALLQLQRKYNIKETAKLHCSLSWIETNVEGPICLEALQEDVRKLISSYFDKCYSFSSKIVKTSTFTEYVGLELEKSKILVQYKDKCDELITKLLKDRHIPLSHGKFFVGDAWIPHVTLGQFQDETMRDFCGEQFIDFEYLEFYFNQKGKVVNESVLLFRKEL